MDSCAFEKLFTKNVPHILEQIFFSLDYKSYTSCLDVSNTWKQLLTSDSYQQRAKSAFAFEFQTELWCEAKRGSAAKVKKLLSTMTVDVNYAMGYSYKTPLSMAAQEGHRDVVNLLLDRGADPNKADIFGLTPLHEAAKRGHKNVVRILLERGGDPNRVDMWGRTPLHRAAWNGMESPLYPSLGYHKEVIQMLHQGGAELNVKDRKGATPLHNAIKQGDRDVVQVLLDAGANPNVTCPRTCPDRASLLQCAAKKGQKDLVNLLLEASIHQGRTSPFVAEYDQNDVLSYSN